MTRTIRLAIAVVLAVVAAQPAFAQRAKHRSHNKFDRGLVESLQTGAATQRVIITVNAGNRAEVRRALEAHGDRIKSEQSLIDALAVEIHSDDLEELANHPWIKGLSLDAMVSASGARTSTPKTRTPKAPKAPKAPATTPTPTTTAPLVLDQGPTKGLRQTLGLPRVANALTFTGSGVGVAIIDSGIAPSADFAGRITGFYDFTGTIPVAVAPFDDYGHGTHIAGLVGSSGIASNYEFQGIAPAVRLVGLKVLDATGQGRTSDVIEAIQFIIEHPALNVQIINLSLGHPIFAPAKDDPLVQAVEQASAAGFIVVASAGNFGELTKGEPGYTGITSPGNAPSAITVGAVDTKNTVKRDDDKVAKFSSRGPSWFDAYAKPNVVAPGYRLPADTTLSSYLYGLVTGGHVKAKNGKDLLSLSGTSMAAGVTSGVAALLVDAHNRAGYYKQKPLTPNLVKAMLEYSAIPVKDADYLTQGAGEINAAGAISLASAINTADPVNSYWLHGSVPGYSTIGGKTVAWGKTILWGGVVFTGDLLWVNNTAWTNNIVWDTNIVWGTSADEGDNIVWGTVKVWADNIVWANRVIGQMDDGDNIVWGTSDDGDNIVWGTMDGDNIVWGTADGDNIVWGTWDGDNIVWGTSDGDNIVWGTWDGDNIVWGTADDGDNIVWGTAFNAKGR